MTEQQIALQAEGLVFAYPGQSNLALSGVDIQLRRGTAVGLLGPNGSGKSTLLDVLMGFRRSDRGRVCFPTAADSAIALVPQDYAFYPDLTCRENLSFFASLLRVSPAEAMRRIDEVGSQCLLAEFMDRKARQCSGGIRRKLNLAIALLMQPDILLLDEPTVGVDPQSRISLIEVVRGLTRKGCAVLYATHYMEEVSALCSDILLLDHGRVLASGNLQDLLSGGASAGAGDSLESLFMHYTDQSSFV